MLKLGLIGLGGMGRGHLTVIERLISDGVDIELVALCDMDTKKFGVVEKTLNLEGLEKSEYDFSKYHLYDNVDEMLEKEELDIVNVVVPTYEHSTVTLKVLNKGINCLCEKPMALSLNQCQLMLDAAKKNNVRLMIGQCQRFGTEWAYVKDVITSGVLGAPLGGFFYRNGGGTQDGGAPVGFNGWYRCREKGGGGLFDQHIHDIDNINYYFGVPKAVSTIGRRVYLGSGYDICSTNYIYDEDYTVHTENTWAGFEPGFREGFRADFEEGTIIVDRLGFRAYQKGKGEIQVPEIVGTEHYNEIKYFADIVANNKENTINPPESSMDTIRIALAEMKSADLNGELVYLGDIK